jgi:ATP-binding cassette subfamily F protein 3
MIRLQQLGLIRGSKTLLNKVDLVIHPGERFGLIGANGSGKTSLFALLRGAIQADSGDAFLPAAWRIAHVAQETPALERNALDYALDGDTTLRQLEAELALAEAAHEGHRIAELHIALQDADAYTASSRAQQLLTGLGFSQTQMSQPVAAFSGGWRMRLNLAQALMCPSDLLLLDEPTNHLDLDAILWLEDWLKRYPGTLIVISHDRDFLDGVVTAIAHIDAGQIKRYGGNYSEFERQRAIHLALTQAAYVKQARERAHLQSFIDRFKAKASKAKQAQSRMKMLARMEDLAPIHASAAFGFEFREPERAPNPLLVLEAIRAGYHADAPILSHLDLNLQSGSRIGLLGVNGAGKSTFIKTLAGELAPLEGKITAGQGLNIGYFAQHQVDRLRHDQSALWHLQQIAPSEREQDLRSFLGSFNFAGEMTTQAIAPFSGGEKARLALALIVWQRPNLLLLDEPTNHLDLETREALTVALAQFEGTLVLVSHDRHLLRASTDEFLIVAEGRLAPFDGDLDDYRNWLFKTRLAPVSATTASVAPAVITPSVDRKEQKRLEAEARQRLASQRKPIEARIKRLEELMARHTLRKTELDTELADPTLYSEANKERVKQALFEQAKLARELEQLEGEWLSEQEQLETLA